MMLVSYYVDFFMANTKEKIPIKIGQNINNLHLKIEKSPFGPSLKEVDMCPMDTMPRQ